MAVIVFIIIASFIVGIVLLTQVSASAPKTREDYLQQLCKYLDGKMEVMEKYKKSYKIGFNFEGFNFVYEDHLLPGFKDAVNMARIKVRSPGKMTLEFHEKTRSSKLIATDLSLINSAEVAAQGPRLKVPYQLKEYTIQTNDIERLNKLFSDKKFIGLLAKFKNQDPRGFSSVAVKIIDGEIILEMYDENRFYPNLQVIRKNIHLIEDPLTDVINIFKLLEKYH